MSEEEKKTEEKPEEVVRGSLFAALGGMEGDKPKPEEPVVEDTETKPESKETTESEDKTDPVEELDGPAPEPTKLSAKDLRVKRKEKEPAISKDEVKKIAPKEEPTPPAPKEEEPEEDYSEFAKRERDTLELLKFGEEKKLSDKGTAKKLAEFYKSRNSFVKKLKEENLDDEEYNVESDPKYRRWKQQNTPPVEVDKLEELRNEQLISKAEERALQRMKAEQQERDKAHEEHMRDIERESLKPKVEAEVSKFSDEVLSAMPEAVTKAMQSGKAWEQIEEEFPIEAPIVKATLNEYSDKAEVLVSMMEGVTQYNPSSKIHQDLRNFIATQAELLAKKPADKTMRGGKRFVKPGEYKGEEDTWTFERKDILQMLKKKASMDTNSRIDVEKKRFDAYMKKAGLTTPTPKEEGKEGNSSPSVKSSPSKPIDKGGSPKRKGLFDLLQ